MAGANPRADGADIPAGGVPDFHARNQDFAAQSPPPSTDVPGSPREHCRGMSTAPAEATAPPESLKYAQSLYDYAAQRLDPFSLRCWIIRRLMLDDGLEHVIAEQVVDRVLASAPKDMGARDAGRLLRKPRRHSLYALRPTARDGGRRRVHLHRPTGHARG